MHNGVLTGPVDGFGSVDWDYVRNIAMRRAMAIRSQGFVHPATLVPDELEYGVGYRARMSILWSRMRPIPGSSPNVKQGQKPNPGNKPQQQNTRTKAWTESTKTTKQSATSTRSTTKTRTKAGTETTAR